MSNNWASILGFCLACTFVQSVSAETTDMVTPVVREPGSIKTESSKCVGPVLDPPVKNYMESLGKRLINNWEPEPGSKIHSQVKFRVEPDGSFHDLQLASPSASAQANFACMQAVVETSRFLKKAPGPMNMETAFGLKDKGLDYNCVADYRQKHQLADDIAIWHVIPLDALQTNDRLTPQFIHNQSNLRAIKKGLEDSERFALLRLDWMTFLRGGKRSEGELKVYGRSMERKYADLLIIPAH